MMKRGSLAAAIAAMTLGSGVARADAPPPPLAGMGSSPDADYAAYERKTEPAEEGEFKHVTLELTPLDWLFNQAGLTFEIVPVKHHALVLRGYYFTLKTDPDADFGRTNLFQGVGGEIGWRYYTSENGPRGVFVGPSLIGGFFHAKSGGDTNPDVSANFGSYGFAVDGGYQAIVADRVVIGIGAGVQYARATRDNPDQAWPASLHANNKAFPRFLWSLGWAF
jgi:hypothetical protein